jgi:hypothetical protein
MGTSWLEEVPVLTEILVRKTRGRIVDAIRALALVSLGFDPLSDPEGAIRMEARRPWEKHNAGLGYVRHHKLKPGSAELLVHHQELT